MADAHSGKHKDRGVSTRSKLSVPLIRNEVSDDLGVHDQAILPGGAPTSAAIAMGDSNPVGLPVAITTTIIRKRRFQ